METVTTGYPYPWKAKAFFAAFATFFFWLAGAFSYPAHATIGWWVLGSLGAAFALAGLYPERLIEQRWTIFFGALAMSLAGGAWIRFMLHESKGWQIAALALVAFAVWDLVSLFRIAPLPENIWWSTKNPKFRDWKKTLPLIARWGCEEREGSNDEEEEEEQD